MNQWKGCALALIYAFLCIHGPTVAHAEEAPRPKAQQLIGFRSSWRVAVTEQSEAKPEAKNWAEFKAPLKPDELSDDIDPATQALWLELPFTHNSIQNATSLAADLRFSGGLVVFLNESEILRIGLDSKDKFLPFMRRKHAISGIDLGPGEREYRHMVGLDPTPLRQGQNTLTIKLIPHPQASTLYFDMRLLSYHQAGFTKGPILQGITSSKAQVFVESSTISLARVEYGVDSKLEQQLILPAVGTAAHHLELTSLEPQTRYFYRVCAEQVWPPEHIEAEICTATFSFVTAPTGSSPFSFVVYGESRSQAPVHRALIERIQALEPAFVIHTGGFTDHGYAEQEWQDEFFSPIASLFSHLAIWPIPGLSDDRHISFFEYFSPLKEKSYYSFAYADADFFMLDSQQSWSKGSMQRRWLKTQLQASKARWRLVFLHDAGFSCSRARASMQADALEELAPLLLEFEVDLVFAGHDHLYARGEEQGLSFVISGGGGAWIDKSTSKPSKIRCEGVHHYSRVTVGEDLLLVSIVDVDGNEIDAFSISAGLP